MYNNEILADSLRYLQVQLVPAILQSFILLVERYEVNKADLPNPGSFYEPIKQSTMTATTGRLPSVSVAFIVIEIRTSSNYNTCIERTSRHLQVIPKHRFEHKCFNESSSLQNRHYLFMYYRQAKATMK